MGKGDGKITLDKYVSILPEEDKQAEMKSLLENSLISQTNIIECNYDYMDPKSPLTRRKNTWIRMDSYNGDSSKDLSSAINNINEQPIKDKIISNDYFNPSADTEDNVYEDIDTHINNNKKALDFIKTHDVANI